MYLKLVYEQHKCKQINSNYVLNNKNIVCEFYLLAMKGRLTEGHRPFCLGALQAYSSLFQVTNGTVPFKRRPQRHVGARAQGHHYHYQVHELHHSI